MVGLMVGIGVPVKLVVKNLLVIREHGHVRHVLTRRIKMVFLAVFGWVILVLMACYVTASTVVGVYVSMGFSGIFPKESIIGFIVAGALLYVVYATFPFTVNINF